MKQREQTYSCPSFASLLAITVLAALATASNGLAKTPPSNLGFAVSFPASAHSGPITGRVFVVIAKREEPEPRLQAGSWGDMPPLFGADVVRLKPGGAALIDGTTLGYPLSSLADIPAGDYYVQALLNVYTQCHRSDGHTLWVHLDQWEGQQFNRSPGNLYSEVEKVHLDPAAGYK